MASYSKTVRVYGWSQPDVKLSVDEEDDCVALRLGTEATALYASEARKVRKALKRALKAIERNNEL